MMTTRNGVKNKKLRTLIKKGALIRLVGAHNGLGARIIERNGFEGVWASGLEISASHAVPDANILSMKEFLEAAKSMADAVSIPIISDCDTGFGNSNNVMHMVRQFEAVGVSAVCIEDKQFPKVNSFVAGRQDLVPVAEFVGKLMAAKNARKSKDFLIFARVEALIAGLSMDEALKRAHAYVDAGADGIFIHSKSKEPDEIIKFCKTWKKRSPLIICPTTYPGLKEKDMKQLGINIVIYANQGLRSIIKSLDETMGHINRFGACGLDNKIASMDEVFDLQGMKTMKKNEMLYLKSGLGSVKAILLAAGDKIDFSLKEILVDRPVAMLDISGKSLLQRNVNTLHKSGIQDIAVISGYMSKNVTVEGAKIIENKLFHNKGVMHSIMMGIDTEADKTVIAYSDSLFDHNLISSLLKREDDIVLVLDRTYKNTHERSKKLELVITKLAPKLDTRNLDVNKRNAVTKIGSNLSEKEAHFEFVGLTLLSKKGLEIFKNICRNKKLLNFSLSDFLQYLIDKGHKVHAFEVSSGWMEVHNFSDYKNAVNLYKET